MNKPLVSVFFITYNHKNFIERSLKSVLEQDYENIEIIIGDDYSQDGQQEILKIYKKKYPNKIKLILNEKNVGVTKNSNIILSNCFGKYIAFFSGDDIMLQGKIKTQVEHLENNPNCILSYHDVEQYDWEENSLIKVNKHKLLGQNGTVREFIKYGMFPDARTIMIRNKNIPKNKFDERIPIASDWLFFSEYLMQGGEIHYINQLLAYYGRHRSNVSRNKYSLGTLDHLNSCNIIIIEHPEYSSEALSYFKKRIQGLRKKENYDYAVMLNALGDIKSILKYLIYIISFKRIKK